MRRLATMSNAPDADRVERENELIARSQQGDRSAFSALVRRHQDEVYTLARRLVGDPHLAADVAQEAFIRAWKAMPRFRGEARFSTWIYRITVNTAWTLKEKARRLQALPIDEEHDLQSPVRSDDPEFAGENLELRGRLQRALDRLPSSQRKVVVLKDVHGWSHAEIAESLDITETAAKVRLHRARAKLMRYLEGSD